MDLEGNDHSLIRDTTPSFGRSARISRVKNNVTFNFRKNEVVPSGQLKAKKKGGHFNFIFSPPKYEFVS
jgi:hypothetical protein